MNYINAKVQFVTFLYVKTYLNYIKYKTLEFSIQQNVNLTCINMDQFTTAPLIKKLMQPSPSSDVNKI